MIKETNTMRRTTSLITLLVATSFVVSCTTDHSRRDDAASQASSSLPTQPAGWQVAQHEIGDVEIGWIELFGDETLVKLVAEAQDNNRNLQAAAANVDRSRALAKQAGAALSPQVSLGRGSSGSGDFDGRTDNQFSLAANASWEVDLWGRLGSGKQAASESAEAAEADYIYSQHSLAAQVASAYFLAIEAKQQLGLSQKTVDTLTQTQRIVQVQFDNGVANQQDLSLVNSDLARAQDGLSAAGGSQRSALRALEILLGRYPGAELEVSIDLPDVPAPPPAGIPSDLLERRPDLVAAERRIASALNVVDQAKAARLPSLSLSASAGGTSSGLSNVLDPGNIAWQAASQILAPLIDGGVRDAQQELATADQKAAVAQYAQAALTAFGDVESALDQGTVLRERAVSTELSLDEAKNALRIAELRFTEGESDLLDVLTIQQRVFNAEANSISSSRSLLDQFTSLNLALGGHW